MSQQIKVEAVTKEPRIWQGKTTWGVKLPGDGGWITLYREQKPNKGDTLDVNISERNVKGRLYVDAFPVMPPLAQPLNGQAGPATQATPPTPDTRPSPKQITWDDYREVAKAAHSLALVLEPDEVKMDDLENRVVVMADRCMARAAIMNTALIAFSNGKFIVPKDDDDAYVPPEDDIPPF